MKRENNNSQDNLFRQVHSRSDHWTPTEQWKQGVMSDIRAIDRRDSWQEIEQMAPGLALAALIVALVVVAVGTLTLSTVPGEIQAAMTNQSAILPDVSFVSI